MAKSLLHLFSAALVVLSVIAPNLSQARNVHPDSTDISATLAHILRRRSSELQGPPQIYADQLAEYLQAVPIKRNDGYWIWMPAHGYMSVPRDEPLSNREKDGTGNLLRYGRK